MNMGMAQIKQPEAVYRCANLENDHDDATGNCRPANLMCRHGIYYYCVDCYLEFDDDYSPSTATTLQDDINAGLVKGVKTNE